MAPKSSEDNGDTRYKTRTSVEANSDPGQSHPDDGSPTDAAINETDYAGAPGEFNTKAIEAALGRHLPNEPPLVWSSVLNAVTSPRDESAALTKLHQERYDSPACPGAETTLLTRLLGPCRNYLEETKSYLASLKRRAAATDPFIDDPGEGTAWATFDLVKVPLYALMSVALLLIGVFTLSQILLASGLPGFEDPLRRYLFSCVPLGGAFALKSIGGLQDTDRSRRRYIGFTGIAGVVLAIAWAWLFVSSFETGAMSSADDVLAELMADPDKRDDAGNTGSALLFVGLIAEMFLAAGCWLEIECIVTGHRRASRWPNPLRVAIDKEISRWTSRFVRVNAFAAHLEARLKAIECGRSAYVSCALNEYRLRCRGLYGHESAATPNGATIGDDHAVSRRHSDSPLFTERRPK